MCEKSGVREILRASKGMEPGVLGRAALVAVWSSVTVPFPTWQNQPLFINLWAVDFTLASGVTQLLHANPTLHSSRGSGVLLVA